MLEYLKIMLVKEFLGNVTYKYFRIVKFNVQDIFMSQFIILLLSDIVFLNIFLEKKNY